MDGNKRPGTVWPDSEPTPANREWNETNSTETMLADFTLKAISLIKMFSKMLNTFQYSVEIKVKNT